MKVRRFYPRQVLRRLQGEHEQLDKGKMAAVVYAMRKGRKLGVSIMAKRNDSEFHLLADWRLVSCRPVVCPAAAAA